MLSLLLALTQAPLAPKPIESLPPLVPDAQAISPDHNRIAISTRDEGVWVLDIATKTIVFRVPPTDSVVEYVTWSTDGGALAILHRDSDVELIEGHAGGPTTRFHADGGGRRGPRSVHFAVRDSLLIVPTLPQSVAIWSVGGDRHGAVTTEDGRALTALALSPDAEWLAVGDSHGTVAVWKLRGLERAAFDRTNCLCTTKPIVNALAFDPTNQWIAIGGVSDRVHLWKVGTESEGRSLPHDILTPFPVEIAALRFIHDGSKLASIARSECNEIIVWDVVSGKVVYSVENGPGLTSQTPMAWFTADGKTLTSTKDLRRIDLASRPTPTDAPRILPSQVWNSDGDYAWAVVDHHLIVRKIPDEEPVLRVKVREN